jgi:hypothetical protein
MPHRPGQVAACHYPLKDPVGVAAAEEALRESGERG